MIDDIVSSLVSAGIWGTPVPSDLNVTQEVFEEMRVQGVAALPYHQLKDIPMDEGVRHTWQSLCMQQKVKYLRIKAVQEKILSALEKEGIIAVVLKGTSAAKYYPHPELRSSGDIDLLVKPGYFEKAACVLEQAGCVCTKPYCIERETPYRFDDIEIELHRNFSLMDDRKAAEKLDSMIFDAMDRAVDHCLPDPENGLVLLQHLNHHLAGGIGIRHFADWMMFAEKNLDEAFLSLTDTVGLRELALSATQLCQQFLGLRELVSPKDQSQLWGYLLENGNFGCKKEKTDEVRAEAIITKYRGLSDIFKLPYRGGLYHLHLKPKWYYAPFVWLYGVGRYIYLLLRNGHAVRTLTVGKKEAEEKRGQLAEAGVTKFTNREKR